MRYIGTALTLVVGLGVSSAAHAVPTYTVTDVGTLGGTISVGYSINNAGQVTGSSTLVLESRNRAFLYQSRPAPGTPNPEPGIIDIGPWYGAVSTGRSISDNGWVTGETTHSLETSSVVAFLYRNGVSRNLGTLGGTSSYGYGVTNSGDVTGFAFLPDDTAAHAFLHFNDGTEYGYKLDLGTLGGTNSFGRGINGFRVTGESDIENDAARHAFIWEVGSMRDLGTLGGTFSSGNSINLWGQVTGRSDIGGGSARHAFIFSNDLMTDLGTLGGSNSEGADINDAGVVVGYSDTLGNAAIRAFIYDQGIMTDLNDLIDPRSGWTLFSANSINDGGQITGVGLVNGSWHAYVLTPVSPIPEPQTFATLLCGLGLLGFMARRRR